jgi:hypothetical protein
MHNIDTIRFPIVQYGYDLLNTVNNLRGRREAGFHVKCFFEEFFLPVSSPNFELNLCPVRPPQMEMHRRP